MLKQDIKPSTSTTNDCTITKANVVSTSFEDLSHSDSTKESFGSFELHSKDIDSKLMKQVGYNGQGLGKKP